MVLAELITVVGTSTAERNQYRRNYDGMDEHRRRVYKVAGGYLVDDL